jgi:hypothetical protein
MSIIRTAATREEEMELSDLRAQADRTTAAAAQALAELTRRITAARRPREVARRLTADAGVAVLRALGETPGKIVAKRGAWRPALAAIPVLAVAAALAYAAAQGKIKFSGPERYRNSAPPAHSPSRQRRLAGRTHLV